MTLRGPVRPHDLLNGGSPRYGSGGEAGLGEPEQARPSGREDWTDVTTSGDGGVSVCMYVLTIKTLSIKKANTSVESKLIGDTC